MQTDATTSQAALTGSPRVSATTAKEIAPTTATAVHISFSRNVIVSSDLAPGFSPRPAGAGFRAQALPTSIACAVNDCSRIAADAALAMASGARAEPASGRLMSKTELARDAECAARRRAKRI